jgi:beta-fructofuranosidase
MSSKDQAELIDIAGDAAAGSAMQQSVPKVMTRRDFVLSASAALSSKALFGEVTEDRLATDRHRPQYHLMPPSQWLNDPNGPLYWKGRYHMFYQYAPVISNAGTKYWGHAVSTDLVHWKNLGIALAPTPGGADKNGCWTGSAVIANGIPTIIYTGGTWSAENERAERAKGINPERQLLAVASDPDDVNLMKWTKIPENPVVAAPPESMKVAGWRDPCVWREGDAWYMLIGSGESGKGGMALLYSSTNLKNWTYLHPFAAAKIGSNAQQASNPFGSMWECPDFFLLNGKPILLVSRGNAYLTGTYSNHLFNQEGGGQIDFGAAAYAQKTMLDDKGRRIWWAWIREKRSATAQSDAGWAGVMSLPKLLTLRSDGALGVEPVPELGKLRGRRHKIPPQDIQANGALLLDGISGDCVEIEAEIELGDAQQCGLRVRASRDGVEQTLIGYDQVSHTLISDTTASSREVQMQTGSSRFLGPGIERGSLDLGTEPLRLRVFIDASVIEVFANGRASISDRVYPSNPASLGIGLFSKGGTARLRSMNVWDLKPISNNRLTSGSELFRV